MFQFQKRFDFKTGSVSVYLGNRVTVDRTLRNVVLDQTEFVSELLERFGMKDSTPVPTPMVTRLSNVNAGEKLESKEHELYRAVVGSLLYLACWSRPDIAMAVSELSRFVSSLCHVHLVAAKQLQRYLNGTKELGRVYSIRNLKLENRGPMDTANLLWRYVDSDWTGCPDSSRSTLGYVLVLNGAAVSWKSKRQSVVALFSAEAEFIAASAMVQVGTYIRKFLGNLGFQQKHSTCVCGRSAYQAIGACRVSGFAEDAHGLLTCPGADLRRCVRIPDEWTQVQHPGRSDRSRRVPTYR